MVSPLDDLVTRSRPSASADPARPAETDAMIQRATHADSSGCWVPAANMSFSRFQRRVAACSGGDNNRKWVAAKRHRTRTIGCGLCTGLASPCIILSRRGLLQRGVWVHYQLNYTCTGIWSGGVLDPCAYCTRPCLAAATTCRGNRRPSLAMFLRSRRAMSRRETCATRARSVRLSRRRPRRGGAPP